MSESEKTDPANPDEKEAAPATPSASPEPFDVSSASAFPVASAGPGAEPPTSRWRSLVFGPPRDFHDRRVFHSISLVAFLAWVGLGADGLSSSAYGPAEAFKAIEGHTYLAVVLALATAGTVLVLSLSYSRIIEHFPSGGGGYVVASKLLGPGAGLVSGSALLVDYVLTITTSVAAAGDAVFSQLPPSGIPKEAWDVLPLWRQMCHVQGWKLPFEIGAICFLTLLNLRGVKESVMVLTPIFLVFLLTHAVLIFGGVATHAADIGTTAASVGEGFGRGWNELGLLGMLVLCVRAYSMGGGTYTGIEAVSNGLPIMREPRVATAKRTMAYLAVSLAVTSGGLLFCYLLFRVPADPGEDRTTNAVLAEAFTNGWGGWGTAFQLVTLLSEGALLVVAAQAGFIDGPRVMSNMAVDSWMPHRFASLSDRLTTHNGVLLMGAASLAALLYTGGRVDALVVMYSINVFLTFSLSQAAMVRFWHHRRSAHPDWRRRSAIFAAALALCATILVITVFEKFAEGGWLTLLITGALVGLCAGIRRHYRRISAGLVKLDQQLARVPDLLPPGGAPKPPDRAKPTAVLLVGGYSGLGIHTLLGLVRFLPDYFHNLVFVTVGVLDSGNFKGADEVERLREHTEESLAKYRALGEKMGFAVASRYSLGTDLADEAEKLCLALPKEFPRIMFFAGKLLFRREGFVHRLLHNETAYAVQRRLQLAGFPTVVLPAKVEG